MLIANNIATLLRIVFGRFSQPDTAYKIFYGRDETLKNAMLFITIIRIIRKLNFAV